MWLTAARWATDGKGPLLLGVGMGEEGAGGEGAQGACPEQLEDDLSGCCFALTLVQEEKHEGLGCATVSQPCPGKR